MRFVTIQIGCDWFNCATVAAEGDGIVEEMTIAIDRKAPRTIGICKQHRDELQMILEPMLAKGVIDKPAAKAPRSVTEPVTPTVGGSVPAHVELTCKVPDCGQVCRGNVGLTQHLKKKHGLTRAQHDELPEVT